MQAHHIIREMGSNVKFETPVKFEVEEAFTFGVTNGKYGGYSIPVKFDPDCKQLAKLASLAEENGATLKLYGGESCTMYFRCDQLTERQTSELFAKGLMIVNLGFEATGTYKRKDGSIDIRTRLTKLRMVRVAEKIKAPAPED